MASVASVSPWHMSWQIVGATLSSWWMPALRLAASEPIGEIVSRLNAWRPEMLVAYAWMARVLAEEQLAGRLNIHPHLIFTSSEVLTQETRSAPSMPGAIRRLTSMVQRKSATSPPNTAPVGTGTPLRTC